MFHDGGYMVGMHAWWWLFWVILIGVLFVAQRGGSSRRQRAGHDSPSAVLQRRLAAGEITPQQYEERKTLLDRDSGRPDGT